MIRYQARACPDVLLVKCYQNAPYAFFKGWATAAAFASFLQPSGPNGTRLYVLTRCISLTVFVYVEHRGPLHTDCKLPQACVFSESEYTEAVYTHEKRNRYNNIRAFNNIQSIKNVP